MTDTLQKRCSTHWPLYLRNRQDSLEDGIHVNVILPWETMHKIRQAGKASSHQRHVINFQAAQELLGEGGLMPRMSQMFKG